MKALSGQRGVVLFAVLATILALALLAGTLAVLATSDIRMAANFKRAMDALYAADAGVQYVKSAIEADLASGSLALGSAVETVNYTSPTGFAFDPVTQIIRTGDTNSFYYQVVGRAQRSKVTVEVVFRRGSIFDLGLFGDKQVDIKAEGNVYVYDSREISDPTGDDSIGGAEVASNGDFLTHQDTFIDGSFKLGADGLGVPGEWNESPPDGSIIAGEPALPVERIDPDPLGMIDGDLADDFAYYSVPKNNNDGDAIPEITKPKYNATVPQSGELILTSGNYYINDFVINQSATVTVRAVNGPVNIYLEGKFVAHQDSVIDASAPTDFRIYAKPLKTPDTQITLNNGGDFSGLIYAPYSKIVVMNTGDFHGIAWGETVEIKNQGDFFIDVALMNEYPNNKIKLVSWKEIRD